MKVRSSRVRLADVAQLAGVSTTTASRALNGRGEFTSDTRAAVIRAADRLGFRPSPFAQSLRANRSNTVGLIVPHLAHPFYASIAQGAQSSLGEAGYRLILANSGEASASVTEAIETLLGHWVDGIMICTTPFTAASFAELLHDTPCIFIDETIAGVGAGSVTLENRRGLELLVDHLAEHGHERIAFLGGPSDQTDGRERREGFVNAMAARALRVTAASIWECEWNLRSGVEKTLALLDAETRPTAVIAASAELALGAIAAARSRGLQLPKDLAVASFDDPYFSTLLEPALTSITYDTLEMGAIGARLLVSAIRDESAARQDLRVPVQLVKRRSCGCDFDVMRALKDSWSM
jgi:LacI family transcriptional regulator